MRTVDATLTAALAAGTGKPVIKIHVGYADGSIKYTVTPNRYKLTGTSLEAEFSRTDDIASDQECAWLERGLNIASTEYTVRTGLFFIESQQYQEDSRQVLKARLFPKVRYVNITGHDTYENVIHAFCDEFGKEATFKAPAEAWLDYMFLPDGKQVLMNDANLFLNLLIQKYLIHCCDDYDSSAAIADRVRFYCADVMGAAVASFTLKDLFNITTTNLRTRQYVWRDENETIHTDGDAADPYHNLGYLESTDSPPARHAPTFEATAILRPDFRIQDGDIVELNFLGGAAGNIFAHPIEIFDAGAKGVPQWRMQLEANPVFENTEGGAMPSTIERISNYTPLNVSLFDHLLSSSDNNLQAAADTLDDHNHTQADVIAANGLAAVIAGGATQWLTPYHGGWANVQLPWPYAATLSKLYINTSSAHPATGTLVLTLYVNAGASALTVTIPAGAAAGVYSDLVNTVTIAAGDKLRWQFVNNAPAANSAQVQGVSMTAEALTTT